MEKKLEDNGGNTDIKPKRTKRRKKPYLRNRDLLNEIILSKEQGELTPLAVEMIMKMSQETIKILKYKYEDDRNDCISTAVLKCLLYWKNFNPEKSKNAFAYFTQIIKNGYSESFNKLHPVKSAEVISLSDQSIRLL